MADRDEDALGWATEKSRNGAHGLSYAAGPMHIRNKAQRARIALTLALVTLWVPAVGARVILIGVDGLSWNRVDPLIAAGELPNLAALMARGTHAELETVEPVNSPVVWTSIATGRSPEAHGVTDFFATRLRIATPSTFERLAHAGRRVGLYDYLVTWPPAALPDGFVIPGWLRRDPSVSPPDVWERIPLGAFVNSFDGARTNADYLERAERDVSLKAPLWLQLMKAFDLEVGAVTFYAVDMTSHRFWEAGFPEQFESPRSDYSPGERAAVHAAMRGVDRSIGQIVAALGADDVVIVASDHGFEADAEGGRDVWVSDVDAALARADLVPQRDGFNVVGTFGAVTVRVQPGPVEVRDPIIERIVAMLRSFKSAAGEPLYASVETIDMAPRPESAQRSFGVRLRQWVVRKAAEFMFNVQLDPTAQAVVFALPDADLATQLYPDGRVSAVGHEQTLGSVLQRQRFTGMHNPIGVFVAAGGPIAARAARDRISVLDISPLIFYAAGEAIPDDLEGALPPNLIRAEALQTRAPRIVPASTYSLPAPAASDTAGSDDPALIEKLRALGYIE
jgi:hypothetical protein